MIFRHFLVKVDMPIAEVNSFICACEDTREAILVDAGKYDPRFSEFVEQHGLNITTIFATHNHPDHIAGIKECADKFGAQIVAGTDSLGGYKADRVVKHGDEIQIGNLTGRVVSTPGHTPEGLCLIFPGLVFTGDALFAGSVGGTNNPDEYEQQIGAIREHLLSLPPDYEVHSGHGPATTIGIESQHGPFFV